MASLRLWIMSLGMIVATCSVGEAQSRQPLIPVEQRIQAARRMLGYFEHTHQYNNFQSALLTLLEVNGDDSASAPLDPRPSVRDQQIKEAYVTWFQIFRALDAMKLPGHNPLDVANLCYLNIAPTKGFSRMDPKGVNDPQERKVYEVALDENRIRCDRNNLQILLPRLDEETQLALHKFLRGLFPTVGQDLDVGGSSFAYALGKSGLIGNRIAQMWEIFETRKNADWAPRAPASAMMDGSDDSKFQFSEDVNHNKAKQYLAEWLHSGDARQAAWATHYILRDRDVNAIPLLLAYVHRQGFDPWLEANADLMRQSEPEVKRAVAGMSAVLDALIVLRVRVPTDDLLQVAQSVPDEALILGLLPEPREEVLKFFYATGGMKPRQSGDPYFPARRDPDSPGELMRWLAAGNEFVNQGSREIGQDLIEHFALALHLFVSSEDVIFGAGGPICFAGLNPAEASEAGWPPAEIYGLQASIFAENGNNPALPKGERKPSVASTKSIESELEVVVAGSPSVQIVRYNKSATGYLQYAPPCPRIPVEDVKAHWMEKLGVGEYGKGRSYDLRNPAVATRTELSPESHDEFSFYKLIVVKGDESYHAELKNWLARQREAYSKVVAGLFARGLITSEQAAMPLKIKMYGMDMRTHSGHPNVTILDKAPWDDVTPRQTEISWIGA
jgi:hypothetical protein